MQPQPLLGHPSLSADFLVLIATELPALTSWEGCGLSPEGYLLPLLILKLGLVQDSFF